MPELLQKVSCRKDWKRISTESFTVSTDDPIGQGIEPNCTKAMSTVLMTVTFLFYVIMYIVKSCA